MDNFRCIKIKIVGNTKEQIKDNMCKQVDEYYSNLIENLKNKAISGEPSDVVKYNLAIINKDKNIERMKAEFNTQIEYSSISEKEHLS